MLICEERGILEALLITIGQEDSKKVLVFVK